MEPEKHDSGIFRFVIGFVALATAVGGFAALFVVKVPAENRDAMMFALGAVFGWAGSVIASEYGATTTGRKVAESAVRTLERQTIANEPPIGTADDPMVVEGAPGGKPVNVKEKKP